MENLSNILDKLLSPEGCPWDRKQTFESLRASLMEEAQEVVDAVDSGDDENLAEELGDLLFNIIFYCKIAERSGRFSTEDMFQSISDKLVRRHPHVFGDVKISTEEELHEQWERIKALEKANRVK